MTWDRTPLEDVIKAGFTILRVTCNTCGRRREVEISGLKVPPWMPLDRLPLRCSSGHAPPASRRWSPPFDIRPLRVSRPPVPPVPDGTAMRMIPATTAQVRASGILKGHYDMTDDPAPWMGLRNYWERRKLRWVAD